MENELISFDTSSEMTITSLELATIAGKQHKNVMQAIRNMEPAWEKINGLKFKLVTYIDQKGQTRPCYSLTKLESLYIATKFNDEARAKLVLRWKELEITALPDFSNPAVAARAWAEQYESKMLATARAEKAESKVLALTSEIEQMQPKVTYYDTIMASNSTVLVTQIAQDYGMSAITFNKTLNDLGVQHKVHGQWILYAKFLDKGYVHSKQIIIPHKDGKTSVKVQTQWTQAGRMFLYKGLKNHGIVPLVERT